MGEVDPTFIQEPEHRPKLATIIEAEDIPLIDLSPLNNPNNSTAKQALVDGIWEASKNWGFFQVINHGVPLETRQKLELATKKFFSLSTKEKMKVGRDEKNLMGYYDSEHTKNVRDWKEVFDFTAQKPTFMPTYNEPDDDEFTEYVNKWPEHLPEPREACKEYVQEVKKLVYKLLGLIALSLGLAEDRLHGFFKDATSFVRLNHYPPCPVPDLALGVGRHKDSGALTILAQDDVVGLEVKRKSDGERIRIKPTPTAYIMRLFSNDRFESVEHRAMVNYERERFSIPFFFNPAHYTNVEPLEELIDEKNPAKYRPYNWGKFRTSRISSNFKKLNAENIQSSHFKVSE